MIEFEMAFYEIKDNMDLAEEMLKYLNGQKLILKYLTSIR